MSARNSRTPAFVSTRSAPGSSSEPPHAAHTTNSENSTKSSGSAFSNAEILRGVIAGAHEGILTFDTEKRFTSWNPAMERIYGVEASRVFGRTVRDCFPWGVADGMEDAFDAALRGETTTVAEREITTRASGAMTLIDATYRPLRDQQGMIVGGVGVLREVAAERAQLQRLRELSAVVEQTGEAVVLTDAQGRITWANAGWERLTGWSLAEVRGRASSQVLHGAETDPNERIAIASAIREGATYRGEVLKYRRDGTHFWSSVSCTPIRDEHGVLQGFVGVERDESARRDEERRVRAERAFAASLVSSNSDGIIAIDERLRITEWNLVMERWSGRSRADAIGRYIDDVVPVPDHVRRTKRLLHVLAGGEPFMQERDYHFPATGVSLAVETVVSTISDVDSTRITGLLFTIRDVGERRAANERFRVIFETSADPHLLLDRNGIIDCNSAALRMLRASSKDDVLGVHPITLSPLLQPDGEHSCEKGFALVELARREGHATFDWVHQRLDGTEVPVEVTLTPVKLRGEIDLLVVWHDLTERHAAEEAIRRERTRLLDAINAVRAGFVMFDADQRLVAVNRAMGDLVPEHMRQIRIGTSLRDVLEAMLVDGRHPVTGEDGATWVAGAMARHAGEGETFEANYGVTPLQVSLARTSDGGSVAFFADIGPLKAIQRSLEEARDAARNANRAKSDFLARMSHELRTPLNAIIGFTKQVNKNKQGNQSARDLEFLSRVEANGLRLLSVVNDILDLAKVEAGRIDVVRETVDLGALVAETVALCDGYPRTPGVLLLTEIPVCLAPVKTDAARLRQIVTNLVSNALKFTKAGEVMVRVVANETGEPTALEVQDTGIGIPADRRDAIFEAFEQASSTTARDFGGTGLGLSISRALSRQLGGDLEVESCEGKGSTFRIVLGR